MLSYLLVWIVSLGSVGFYLSGFLLPEVARKYDPIWSGLGLIYALDLLADHSHIRGGVLLGQMASVALIVWFGWQTVQQRRQLTPETERTPLPNSIDGALPFLKQGWERLQVAYGQALPDHSDASVTEIVVEPKPSAVVPDSVEADLDEDETPEPETPTTIMAEAVVPAETVVAEPHPDSPAAATEPLTAESSPNSPEPELPEAETTAESLEPVSETQDEITEPEISAAVSAPLEASSAAEETATVEEMPSEVNETVIASEKKVEETVNDLADTATEDDEASAVSVEEPEHTPEISDLASDHESESTVAAEIADSHQSTDKTIDNDDSWPPPDPVT